MVDLVEPRRSLLADRSFWRKVVVPVLVLGVAPVLINARVDPLTFGGVSFWAAALALTVGSTMAALIGASVARGDRPRRPLVLAVLVTSGLGAIAVAAFWVQMWIIDPDVLAAVTPAQWGSAAGIPLVLGLMVVFGAGVGLLIRKASYATVVIFAWIPIEVGVSQIPLVSGVRPWMPFTSMYQFLTFDIIGEPMRATDRDPWASIGGVALLVGVLLTIGLVVARRRVA